MDDSTRHPAASAAFLASRDLLLEARTDYARAVREFQAFLREADAEGVAVAP